MNSYFDNNILNLISKIALQENLELYVVGGYVRDSILQRPSKDIDIVVIGNGIDLAKKVAKAAGGRNRVSVFKNFGTAMIHFNDYEVEFVGARKESYRSNSRKPIVENGSLEDDQKRRDFTINALAIGLGKENYGQMIDPFNGIEDLKKGHPHPS
jgi:poly(A) polymerase